MTKSQTGLFYNIESEGKGEPILYNDIVSFKYTGKLLNGEVFDKSLGTINLKVNQLIGAWKEIMTLLKPGGKAKLISPPQLGYGDKELDKIPANSCLYFEIEIISVK
jgi:FKBP-type peptidyl-prolyl cis-trans isomerase